MLIPDTEAALADMILSAKGPLSIRGGGTRGLNVEGEALSTSGLSGITLYEPGALTVVAKVGTPLCDLEKALAEEDQRLAFEPRDMRALLGTTGTPTIGGVVATNASGPRRIQGGSARDYALGVRYVDGAGNIVKNGGRVMKNVTGYDLVKLMCGSHGTLGIVTEVSLKVLPVPETQATLMLRGLDDAEAVRAMSVAMQSPFEVSGAAHCAKINDGGVVTMLRLEGFEKSVSYRVEALKDRLKSFNVDMCTTDDKTSHHLWQRIKNVDEMSGLEGDVWRVLCKPSEAATLMEKSQAEGCYCDWGGGLIWFRTRHGSDLREKLGTYDGHATLVRASDETRRRLGIFQKEARGVARLSAGLRQRFDPRGILNPGLMGSEPALEDA